MTNAGRQGLAKVKEPQRKESGKPLTTGKTTKPQGNCAQAAQVINRKALAQKVVKAPGFMNKAKAFGSHVLVIKNETREYYYNLINISGVELCGGILLSRLFRQFHESN